MNQYARYRECNGFKEDRRILRDHCCPVHNRRNDIRSDNRIEDVIEVISELELAADFEHVTDIKEIGRYGVMGMPALIINNEVKCVGSVPPRNRMIKWLKEAQK